MFGLFGKKYQQQEQELAQWLAHPNEFGQAPSTIKHRRAFPLQLMNFGETVVHLIDYQMPSGTKGRGFVNPITWSFLGDEINAIPDEKLLVAYCGWAFLFPGIQAGGIETKFESNGEEQRYLDDLTSKGLTEIIVEGRYRIGTSELYGFKAKFNGEPVRGAGNTETEVGYTAAHPCIHLPSIYFLLGQNVIRR